MVTYNTYCVLICHTGGVVVLLAGFVGLFSSVQLSAQVETTSYTNNIEIIMNMENYTHNAMTASTNLNMDSRRILDVSIVHGSSNLTDTAFQPNPVNIKVGDTVRWTNDHSVIHTITEGNPATGNLPEERFESDLMNTGQTFEQTFNQTGTFDYYCDLHHNMVGQVIVS